MPAFDRSFTPPAPVADVVIAHPVSSAESGVLRGKLDTGADLTVIPETLIPLLALTAHAHLWARGYDGTFSQRPVYYQRLTLEGYDLPAIRRYARTKGRESIGKRAQTQPESWNPGIPRALTLSPVGGKFASV